MSYMKHNCPSAYKKNVQVPVCPLCNKPVPTERGVSPDLSVGNHIDNFCQSDRAHKKKVKCPTPADEIYENNAAIIRSLIW